MKITKKILFVINTTEFFISHRLPIARAAYKKGYEIHVATADVDDKILKEEGFSTHKIKLNRSGLNIFKELSSIKELFTLYSRLRPDIIHHVTIKPIIYGGIAARFSKAKCVINAISGLGFVYISKKLKYRIMRKITDLLYAFVFRHPNCKVIFQNVDDYQMFINKKIVSKEKSCLIRGSGVDINKFCYMQEPQGRPKVVMVSRLLWDKGVKEFINAAQLLKQKTGEIEFILIGDCDKGNPSTVTLQEIKELTKQNEVTWLGKKNNIDEIFKNSNIVCLPSYREGLPKVLLEAASVGRAIVTTDVPGCREIVKHNKNGLLVSAQDHVALAEAIQFLIDNPKKRQEMGFYSRKIIEKEFSIEKIIDKSLALYQEVI